MNVRTRTAAGREKLRDLKISPDHSFRLDSEKAGEAYWVRLKNAGKTVEGKLFLPEKTAREVIIFNPGFAGDAVKWFEDKHVEKMVKAGYAVLVLRHNGISTGHEKSDAYINCPERSGMAELGEYTGGKAETSFSEWAREPETAISALKGSFQKIHLIGHSFGGMSSALALTRARGEAQGKIESWIGLSPATGDFPKGKEGSTAKTAIVGGIRHFNASVIPGLGEESAEEWVKLARELHANAGQINPDTRMLVYAPLGDEYVGLSGVNKFLQKAGSKEAKGFVYAEKRTSPQTRERWREKHDFRDLKPEELIQFIQGKRKPRRE